MGQGNIFRSVCQEFCSEGGCLPHCMLGYIPLDRRQAPPGVDLSPGTDPQEQTPPEPEAGSYPPPSRSPSPHGAAHAGKYGQQAGSTHPTGMQSSCRFLHYLDLKKFSKCEIRCHLLKGITFQGCRL